MLSTGDFEEVRLAVPSLLRCGVYMLLPSVAGVFFLLEASACASPCLPIADFWCAFPEPDALLAWPEDFFWFASPIDTLVLL